MKNLGLIIDNNKLNEFDKFEENDLSIYHSLKDFEAGLRVDTSLSRVQNPAFVRYFGTKPDICPRKAAGVIY